ncbi:AbrB/MazE/SpoVT family DNA-binding domain-containing protein [Mesorhizobium sp. WSM2561]|uniref:AbrB/MazE/SpoVT family DNA-binding domain-containing protein n=1 Tax=Mesorhizobium sp. WSM2561 TaxID=1040985 RepID=UPI0032AF11CB
MRVTTKGQVTIPEEIRDRLGIGPGSEVEFLATEDGVRFVLLRSAKHFRRRGFP